MPNSDSESTALRDATAELSDAHELMEKGREEEAMMAVEESMETLRNLVRSRDGSEEEAPMWEIAKDDVEDYVGCELADVAFGALGTSAVLVFERDDGSLHGFKLQPRENIMVCDVEVA